MMMHLFDNHNHSEFSFDGKRSSVERCVHSALSKGLWGIAFTDHCDFFIPEAKRQDENLVPETFDVIMQQKEIDRVQSLIADKGFNILKGIEIGMYEDFHEEIREILASNKFDQVIASVHYIEQTDPYYGGFYDDKNWKDAYYKYLEAIYREMTWMGDFDIMGHYDYIVRYAPYKENCIRYKDFSDIFDAMFKYLIQEGKALEINTKSYGKHGDREVTLDLEVLKRYREMGGEIISLGSDSHDPIRPGDKFGHHAELLRSLGFRWTAHYEKRKLVQIPL
jgi:histidinol-phosphatase (PHP family)